MQKQIKLIDQHENVEQHLKMKMVVPQSQEKNRLLVYQSMESLELEKVVGSTEIIGCHILKASQVAC